MTTEASPVAFSPVTVSGPRLKNLRSPPLTPLKFETALVMLNAASIPVRSVLPLLWVFSVPAMIVPRPTSLIFAAFSVTVSRVRIAAERSVVPFSSILPPAWIVMLPPAVPPEPLPMRTPVPDSVPAFRSTLPPASMKILFCCGTPWPLEPMAAAFSATVPPLRTRLPPTVMFSFVPVVVPPGAPMRTAGPAPNAPPPVNLTFPVAVIVWSLPKIPATVSVPPELLVRLMSCATIVCFLTGLDRR